MYEHELNAFLKRHVQLLRVIFLAIDLVLLNIAYHVSLAIRFNHPFPFTTDLLNGISPILYRNLELYLSACWLVISVSLRLYVGRRGHPRHEEIRELFRALLLLFGAILLYIVGKGGYNFYSRSFLIYFFLFSGGMMLVFRLLLRTTLAAVRTKGVNQKDILIIGASRAGERFYNTVLNNPGYGYNVLGFLDNRAPDDDRFSKLLLGGLHDLPKIVESYEIDEVVIAIPKATEENIAELVTACENFCIRVNVIPDDYAAFEGRRVIEQIGEFSLVRMREAPLDIPLRRILKRSFDVAFSALVLLLVFPWVFLLSATLIKLSSRGPIFFKQLRTGEDGGSFECYKFRTMRTASRELSDSLQAVPGDPRLTGIGKLLRRTSLDELPQFWNVLKGEMSVVGPRPHMLKHTEDYRNVINQYMVRHFVKPGLTGWAQVNGFRGATQSPDQMERRIEHDLYYIENWSFLLDLAIIGKTVGTLLRGDENAY